MRSYQELPKSFTGFQTLATESRSKREMGCKTLVILPVDWWPAPGHSSATWHSLSWSWRKWIGNKFSRFSHVLSCALPGLCEGGIITIIITLNNYGWKLWFKERDRKKLMSPLFCVWDAMFAQCCDKGNCHFSDWGQGRLYRKAHLGVHLSFSVFKTHSFISSFVYTLWGVYDHMCVVICTCVVQKKPEEGIRSFFFQPSHIPLSQGLSLNPGLSSSQLSWKPACLRNTLDSSTIRARITATYMMISLLCGFWDLNSVLVIMYQILFSYLPSHLSSLSFTILCFD